MSSGNKLETANSVQNSWIGVVIGDNPFDRKFRSGISIFEYRKHEKKLMQRD